MDQDSIKQQLLAWMEEFVEQPNANLGNWAPCPYARAARINNQISIVFSTVDNLYTTVKQQLGTLDNKEAVVICFDHNDISPEALQEQVTAINQHLMPQDYVVLEDHPDAPEYVNRVKMNFGQCGLMVLQQLTKLNSAADRLQAQGYYSAWDKNSLDSVVTWRR